MQASPPTPPSAAQANRTGAQTESPRDFAATVVRVLKNPKFSILNISYGINVGVFCAFMTFLNQMILIFYPVSIRFMKFCLQAEYKFTNFHTF